MPHAATDEARTAIPLAMSIDINAQLGVFQLPGTGQKRTCQQCRLRKVIRPVDSRIRTGGTN